MARMDREKIDRLLSGAARDWPSACLRAGLRSLEPVYRSVVGWRNRSWDRRDPVTVPVPVISFGNLTTGGTGKTPFVIWLVEFLKQQGYRPGIISRGVGGKQSVAPRRVTSDSSYTDVGDESLVLFNRTQVPVYV